MSSDEPKDSMEPMATAPPTPPPDKKFYDLNKPMAAEYYSSRAISARTSPSQTTPSDVAAGTSSFVDNSGYGAPRLDTEYYEQWRKEKAAAVERGEDPYAKIAARAKERSEGTFLGRVSRFFKGRGKREREKKDDHHAGKEGEVVR